ncbi:WD40-repeat-containing domain protein [Glomus cerebriforme]|uniref:WD40-repeat-containing domain protein n=1 Tax=Glomus cerebriforme TaxID=658196 RepID=A0A397TA34_9GLOM|nr:WD40-repeat-containing domain protein [Glomus cerebriforme]
MALTHILVLKFLEYNNYTSTLESFRQEAKEIIENEEQNNEQTKQPLTAIIQEYLFNQLQSNVENMSLERNIDDYLITPGNNKYPRYLCESFSQIHTNNILSVRTQTLTIRNFNDGEYQFSEIPTIITGSADKSIRLTSLLTGDTFNVVNNIHKGGIICLDFHPNYNHLMLTGSMDSTCSLINVSTLNTIQTFKDHSKYVVRAKFSIDGNMIVTASYDHTINIYNVENGENTPILSPTSPGTPLLSSTTNIPLPKYNKIHSITFGGNIESICFLSNDQYLVVGIRGDNYLHYINLVNFSDKKYNMNSNGDDWVSFTPMDISPSPHNHGKYLLVSTDDENGRIILFRTHSSQQIYNFYDLEMIPDRKLTNPRHCWHPNGKYFFTFGVDSFIRVYDVATKTIVHKLQGHKDIVRDLWFDQDRDLLISCGFDKTVKIWSADDATNQYSNN